MELLLLIGTGVSAGALGAMFGIGGGVLLVPVLVLVFGVPIADAVPSSLMCVVANSCAAAASYVEEQLADVRLALSLELATVAGAIAGGLVAVVVSPSAIALAFGCFALYVGCQMVLGAGRTAADAAVVYQPQHYLLGVSGSFVAGGLSALLGVGGGPLKVPLMSYGMNVPFKVATATSNLMVGVTGAASVAMYAWHGHVKLALVAPLVVGVLVGAQIGARMMIAAPTVLLKRLFGMVLLAIALQMLLKEGHALWLNA
ncbi:MAG TPA: sulfite exporter TauE/SafE family protein [Myxococcaceae bacterium]|nr:sulfite exporter TauE/SafE family protein [Myxococcaceae bacterium]